ncbi:MAG: ATP-binding protein, partial [Chloroflexota bacterium]
MSTSGELSKTGYPESFLRTFMIADVRNYTAYTLRQGDEAGARLAEQFARIVEEVVSANGGEVLGLRGDESMVVFVSARQALRAALLLQDSFSAFRESNPGLPLEVGIGIAAGDAVRLLDGYRGGTLNLAARLCSVAAPGEILASMTVAGLTGTTAGVTFLDRGEVIFKGFDSPVAYVQIVREGTEASQPARILNAPFSLASRTLAPSRVIGLDQPATPFVGRVRESAEILALLQSPNVRLVTLTGPGGTGKTRLAQHVAQLAAPAFPDGAYFVSLSTIRDASLVCSLLADALQLAEGQSGPLIETIKDYLRNRKVLLVLDNCEQVAGGLAVAGTLLASGPGLAVLTTSRAPLRLAAEYEYAIPPLSLPLDLPLKTGTPIDLDVLRRSDAIAYFIDRASAAKAGFVLTEGNAASVAAICQRLDGLPLAIELAAARLRLFPLPALLARLSNRLQMLSGGSRDAPDRQQTLRGAIDWSYQLLNVDQRRVFAALSVFAGGCSLEAIEAVALDGGDLGTVESLIEQSLLRQEGEVEPRIVMLPTIQDFARERLLESGDGDAVAGRHALFFLSLAEEASPELRGRRVASWLRRLDLEHDNLRGALRRVLEQKDGDRALRLVSALWRFWWARGHLSEGRKWVQQALSAAPDGEPVALANALSGAGNLAWSQGDYETAISLHHRCLELRKQIGDTAGVAMTLNNLGAVAEQQGRREEAQDYYERSLETQRAGDDTWSLAVVLGNLVGVLTERGEYARATELGEESLALWRVLGDTVGLIRVLNNLGFLAVEKQEYARAREVHVESLIHCRDVGNNENLPACLEGLARLAAAEHRSEVAARIWGSAEAIREKIGQPLPPSEEETRRKFSEGALADCG